MDDSAQLPQTPLSPPPISVGIGKPEFPPVAEISTSPESAEVEVIPESPEVSPELVEHVQAVQRGEIQLPGPIDVGAHEGQPVSVQPSAPQQPNIVLPLTKDDIQTGQKQPTSSAFRWLTEWVKWLIKKYPGRALYKSE